MKRKFSIDIPKLKRMSKLEFKDDAPARIPTPESRPVSPKSVRPPLPMEIEAALRVACLEVIRFNKPSHEYREEDCPKPALDYAVIRSPSNSDKPTHKRAQFSYRPDVALENLFNDEDESRPPRANHAAHRRADQLMRLGSASKPVTGAIAVQASEAPVDEPHSEAQRPSPADDADARQTGYIARSDSTRTADSTAFTSSPENAHSYSTAVTSAAITPALSSNRTSSQVTHAEIANPKSDGAWLERNREKQRKAREEQHGVAETLVDQDHTSGSTVTAQPAPHLEQQRAASANAASQPTTHVKAHSRQVGRTAPPEHIPRSASSLRPQISRNTAPSAQQHDPIPSGGSSAATRPQSGYGRPTGGVTNRVMPDSSSTRQPSAEPSAQLRPSTTAPTTSKPRSRSTSRTRNIGHHIREYFRPGYSLKPRSSIDSGRGRNPSSSSVDLASSFAPRDNSQSSAAPEHHERRYFQHPRGNSSGHIDSQPPRDSTRSPSPASAALPSRGRGNTRTPAALPAHQQHKDLDLNRELPPLPSLDSWHDQSQDDELLPSTTPLPPLQIPSAPPRNHNTPASTPLSLVSKFRLRGTSTADSPPQPPLSSSTRTRSIDLPLRAHTPFQQQPTSQTPSSNIGRRPATSTSPSLLRDKYWRQQSYSPVPALAATHKQQLQQQHTRAQSAAAAPLLNSAAPSGPHHQPLQGIREKKSRWWKRGD